MKKDWLCECAEPDAYRNPDSLPHRAPDCRKCGWKVRSPPGPEGVVVMRFEELGYLEHTGYGYQFFVREQMKPGAHTIIRLEADQ